MRFRQTFRWATPSVLLVASAAFAASPDLDGNYEVEYGAALTSQESSVIEIFSPPFALELQTDNSNIGGVDALAATNFKSEPSSVTTGLELTVPLQELGWDGVSDIKLCIFVNGANSDFLANQVSGGLVTGTPAGDGGQLGAPPFDFEDAATLPDVGGLQFVTVTDVLGSATITIDGTADEGDWPAPLYANGVQAAPGTENPTSFADNNDPDVFSANGSEIDAIRAFRTSSELYIHIAGNAESNFNKFEIFIDCDTAGPNQNPLPNIPLPNYAGLGNMINSVFDTAFSPDYYFRYTRGNCGGPDCQFLDAVELGNAGATGGGDFIDIATPIAFTGPSAFNGAITAQCDNSNVLGVTGSGGGDGVDVPVVSDPALVATGTEFRIDLDALGWNGADDIRIGGFIAQGDQMSNQVIGGLPNDTGFLGPGDGVDFDDTAGIAGDQFVTLTPVLGAAPTIDGLLDALLYTAHYVNNAGTTGNSTTLGDATAGGGPDVDPDASEIDGLHATVHNDGATNWLYCFVAGNVGAYNRLAIFIDSKPGGQNVMRDDNIDVSGNFYNNLAGMQWDAAFVPNFSVLYNLGTNLGDDGLPGGIGPNADFVEHFVDGVELTTLGAEEQPTGGPFDGGVKSSTNLVGDLISRIGFGNNTDDTALFANGSELNAAYAYVDSDYLWILLTGNLETNFSKLEVFLDLVPFDVPSQTGGQNVLLPPDPEGDPEEIESPPESGNFIPNPDYDANPAIDFNALDRMGGPVELPGSDPPDFTTLHGLTFDAGFTADHYVFATNGGEDPIFVGQPQWFGGIARLRGALRDDPANAGVEDPGVAIFWGNTSAGDFGDFLSTGTLAGLYMDQANTAANGEGGVDGGPDQYEPNESSPAGVTTGIELRIALDEIRVPGSVDPLIDIQWDGLSNFKLCVFINGGFHSFVSNQFLQPICANELGEPRSINLETEHPGAQFMELTVTGVNNAYTNLTPTPPACIEPSGACCVAMVCSDPVLFGDCIAMGGEFLGDGTDCTGGCPEPEGACCLAAGAGCAIFTETICTGSGGTYQGDGTDCGTVVCPTTIACCFSAGGSPGTQVLCLDLDESACCAANGLIGGPGTSCGVDDCNTLVCKGDMNGDGTTNALDFALFAPAFGTLAGATRCTGDLDGNGAVDSFDFSLFAPDFGCNLSPAPAGQCCAP